uniref:ATP synthase complex subunit 8 n=1 Tax=Tenuibranchiurus glypticus TaxID=99779 RepID=A0A0A0QXE2_9EUCA|nr:ATP synthase F0 subunit 8 [Tenuibranchiurus glypticus]AIU94538.1 ATP synthase F0 subunit 8 [Tenuibranchiurus glypticus]
MPQMSPLLWLPLFFFFLLSLLLFSSSSYFTAQTNKKTSQLLNSDPRQNPWKW